MDTVLTSQADVRGYKVLPPNGAWVIEAKYDRGTEQSVDYTVAVRGSTLSPFTSG